jgi:hypothetical protein
MKAGGASSRSDISSIAISAHLLYTSSNTVYGTTH